MGLWEMLPLLQFLFCAHLCHLLPSHLLLQISLSVLLRCISSFAHQIPSLFSQSIALIPHSLFFTIIILSTMDLFHCCFLNNLLSLKVLQLSFQICLESPLFSYPMSNLSANCQLCLKYVFQFPLLITYFTLITRKSVILTSQNEISPGLLEQPPPTPPASL